MTQFFIKIEILISEGSPYLSHYPCEISSLKDVSFTWCKRLSSEILLKALYHHRCLCTVQWEHLEWNFASYIKTKVAMQLKSLNKTILVMCMSDRQRNMNKSGHLPLRCLNSFSDSFFSSMQIVENNPNLFPMHVFTYL